jgi:hypothetical protein
VINRVLDQVALGEKPKRWLLKFLGTTRFNGRVPEAAAAEEGLGGRLWWLDHVDDWLGQGAQKNVKNAAFEGGQMLNPQAVDPGDGKNSGDKNSEDGKEKIPGRRMFFDSIVLADRV